jgi:hypothetical protein
MGSMAPAGLQHFVIAAVVASVIAMGTGQAPSPATCPPPGFDAVKDLNLTEYISAPWYIQAQVGQRVAEGNKHGPIGVASPEFNFRQLHGCQGCIAWPTSCPAYFLPESPGR